MNYLVKFDVLAWESPALGIRQKVYRGETRLLRLVEYSQTMTPHWCSKGHLGHIVDGVMEIEFATGTYRFEKGDAVFIPPGQDHAHRAVALTALVTALFVEDV